MVSLYGHNWTRREIRQRVGHMDQVAGIKATELADGLARGSRMFQVWTGSGLYFEVLAERALDISVCRYKGMPLAWVSSVGEAHPAFYEPQGSGWLRSYPGGLFVTGGLDHFGAPFSYAGEEAGLHGRASNLPARSVGYRTYWSEDDYILEITGEVRQACVFGENLVLRRRISTRLGSNSIHLEDVVTNEGFAPQRHMILYHFNIGFPLVSEDSRLHLEVEETIPHDADSEVGLAEWRGLQPPTARYLEQNFWHVPVADDRGDVHVELENPGLGLGLRWTYNRADLPYLLQWKMMGEGTYLMGIEPCNSRGVVGRAAVPERDVPHLGPGESRHYVLELEVLEYPTLSVE